jgi:hypothetical protein
MVLYPSWAAFISLQKVKTLDVDLNRAKELIDEKHLLMHQ